MTAHAQPATDRLRRRPRWTGGPAALAAAGALFLLYPAVRPWGDSVAAQRASAFAAPAWLVAHLSGAVGFILLAFGLLALRLSLPEGPGARAARAALATTGFGVGLTLLYYGAETFALHEIGRRALAPGAQPVGELVDQIRNGPAQLTVFGLGLLLVAAGGVLAAVAAWRSGRLRRWSGIPLAAGLVLYLPQFFAPPAARIAHGLLMAVGCLALAAGLRLAEAHRAGTVSPSAEPRSR